MITEADYNVDVWLWSSARSDPNSYALFNQGSAEHKSVSDALIFSFK
tara:strand:+ start:330 stop:470 length:141 start_codon:yes stop_codon:yes gene_type:complete